MSRSNKKIQSNVKVKRSTSSSYPMIIEDVEFEVLPSPVKSASDKKDYKVIRLKNGLTACLIADVANCSSLCGSISDSDSEYETESEYSESEGSCKSVSDIEQSDHEDSKMKKVSSVEQKMAAAALCIGVGSFSDPQDIPGLAHFLEHMVFMGSEKFPQENDFDSFIKKRGGSDNASTDNELTTFYFECLEKHLYRGLDKFAQFFIAPLMKKESMTREREAIESEFQMAVPSDVYRKEQLLMSLFNSTVPVNSFSWGNLKTLRDNVDDDILYQKLHDFRLRHYSAHRMTLAIQARLPMDMLQSYVLECFSSVPNNKLPPDDFREYTNIIFDTSSFKKIYYIKPMKDIIQIDLTWPMPSLLHLYKSKPHQYISWLLGDEGKGSLLSYLKKRVWALGIYSGNDESGSDHNSIYALFTISIVLTNEGLHHLKEVLDAVYSYINFLKSVGPQERLFREIQLIEETAFRFTDEDDAADTVEDLTECMQFYPPEDYLTGSELYFEYDPEAIKMVMSYLNSGNMNIMVLSTHLPKDLEYNKFEPWFNTPYTDLDIPKDWTENWEKISPFSDFILPPTNPFITSDFSILPEIESNHEFPEKVVNTSMMELWYRKDQKFKLPVVYYYYYFINPFMGESALNACMTEMFLNLLGLQLNEEIYPAVLAGLSYSISHGDRGIVLKLDGYNQRLPVLIEVMAKYIKNVSNNLTLEVFEAVKDKQAKIYYNKFLKPSTLAKDVRLSLLVNSYWTVVEKYNALLEVNFGMIKSFSEKVVRNFFIQGLIQGNVDKETAVKVSEKLVNILECEPLPDINLQKMRVVKLPPGEFCVRLKSFNKNDTNSVITNYYQSEQFSFRTSVIIELLMMFVEEPLFDILRTKEQLGYHVFCTVRDTFGILGYSITVNAQAVKNTTDYVDLRIEAFIKHMNKLLKKMSDKKINQLKRDLIKIKRCADVDLEEEVGRNWAEISTRDYIFDRWKQEIDTIEELKISEIKKFWEEHNMFGSKSNFKKLSIQIVGHNLLDTCDVDDNSDQGKESDKKISPKSSKKSRNVERENSFGYSESRNEEIKRRYSLEYIGRLNQKENRQEDYFIKSVKEYKEKLKVFPSQIELNKK